jgi:hypothetical protein
VLSEGQLIRKGGGLTKAEEALFVVVAEEESVSTKKEIPIEEPLYL